MRVAITTRFRQIIGGIEVYLQNIVPELSGAGLDLGMWYEEPARDGADRSLLLPEGEAYVRTAGRDAAARSLADWRPDVIFNHGASDLKWESRLLTVAPVVQFCHDYRGTCISGNKAWKSPIPKACDRQFGWQCLAHYFPHRCGGLNPLTMIEGYTTQSHLLRLLRQCAAIATASEHIRAEYIRHGVDSDRVVVTGLYIPKRHAIQQERAAEDGNPVQLLFCGRMAWLKGGRLLLDAAPIVSQRLGRPVNIKFVGDGPERPAWREHAAKLQAAHPSLGFEFIPWISSTDCETIYSTTDLVVVPSIWPEPFGLVGAEAGRYSVPAAAFATGGISDWLTEGVNGHLARCDPPAPAPLADAIVRCLADPLHYSRLREGALQLANRMSLESHLAALLPVLNAAARRQETAGGLRAKLPLNQ